MKSKILIIDDELSMCTFLSLALSKNYEVQFFTDAQEALLQLEKEKFDLILLDLMIGSVNGIEILKKIHRNYHNVPVIMMTAYGSIPTSVEAIREGAFTYLVKPLNVDELTVFIEQALSMKKITEECAYLKEELNSHYSYHEIVGTSPPIQKIFRMIDRLKDVDTGVMIYGESGTGKELVARALHQLGHRSSNRFVAINCAAVPESLMEDELFGHKRGTFTGAAQDRKGKLEIADKGTLFLDEIGDMPLALQGKLLRVLQQKEYSPLGSNEVYPLDIRVLAATNRNLERMMQEGSFRQDLYFRLNVVSITMPPLRERREDIPLLCSYFLRKLEEAQKREHMTVSPQALNALMAYEYPGNVRQLSNILEHAMILSSGSTIDLDSLPDVVRCATLPLSHELDFLEIPNITIREMEKRMIQSSLYRNHGKREATASELGISLRSLFNKIKEYDIALEKS